MNSKPNLAYLVNLMQRAQHDLDQLYRRIDAGASESGLVWYRHLDKSAWQESYNGTATG